ncbi:MAG: HlyD family efflux transporter periplasmic adaptor subunit [Aquabacterium sp.]|nr:MAG: HlyD family efflux transporter periplasmic adaptor subunit [Aquabacterium sp.]
MKPLPLRSTLSLLAAAAALSGCLGHEDAGWSGYAQADLVYIASPAGGLLQKLEVSRGDKVAAAAPLYQIDSAPEAYSMQAAQAQQQRADAQVADLNKGRREQELRALEAQLKRARAALEISTSQLERNRQLVKQGFQSAARLDELNAAYARDAAGVREAEAQLKQAREGARPDQIAAARSDKQAAAAQVSQVEWQAEQKRRTAPVASAVFDVLYRVGEWVPAGSPVVALLPDGAVKLRFFVPQAALSRVRPGQVVHWSCDGCAGGTAKVSYVSQQAEFTPPVIYSNESRGKLVFLVEAVPEGPSAAELKPGQPLEVRPTVSATKG